jgi:hypothetical protein
MTRTEYAPLARARLVGGRAIHPHVRSQEDSGVFLLTQGVVKSGETGDTIVR